MTEYLEVKGQGSCVNGLMPSPRLLLLVFLVPSPFLASCSVQARGCVVGGPSVREKRAPIWV